MGKESNTGWILIGVVAGILVLLSILQTYKVAPHIFTKELDVFMTKMTFGLILLTVIYVFIIPTFFRIREGFADTPPDPIEQWKKIVKEEQLTDLCSTIQDVQSKMALLEKGSPPDELTDDQARELVKDSFTKNIPSGPFSCVAFKQIQANSDLDNFVVNLQTVPDTYLVQAHETALYCEKQYIAQLDTVKGSLDVKKAPKVDLPLESFVDVCTPDIVEQRKKLIRDKKLSEAAEKCLLPEEVPGPTKQEQVSKKIEAIQNSFFDYKEKKKITRQIPEIVKSCKKIAADLEAYKNKAQSGALASDIKT
jgi:hypothetical protein